MSLSGPKSSRSTEPKSSILVIFQRWQNAAISDCEQVLRLNPVHFGALHGLGICHAALGEYSLAIQAFRRALEIQPYSLENQRFLLECSARLS
jgi:tetratricopeptide (TPR) repeat protein